MDVIQSSKTLKLAGTALAFGLAVEAGVYAYLWTKKMLFGVEKNPVSTLLFFPDEKPLCKSMYAERGGCHKTDCNFSHDENSCFGKLMQSILSARQSLDLCVFCFTSPELANSVIFLHEKGVRVRLITDREQVEAANAQVGKFRENGVAVRHNKSSYLMHHKFAIVDKTLLINGSFNWTRQAITGNNENVLITEDKKMVQPFLEEFQKLWDDFNPKTSLTATS